MSETRAGVSRAKRGEGALPPSYGLPRDISGPKKMGAARDVGRFARETPRRAVGQGGGNPAAAGWRKEEGF